MQEALKREFITQYLDEDGLGHLENEKGLQHTTNSNGILFAVYGYMQLHRLGINDGADFLRFYHAVKSLTVEPGLYMRRPNTQQIPESHDNRAAIAIGSCLFDCTFARDLVDYGTRKGFQYSNQDTSKYSLNQLTQGGDIALYKICAGYLPYPTEWVWLLVGMLVGILSYNKPRHNGPSVMNLFYLRAYGIDVAFKRYTIGASALWYPFHLSWNFCKPLLFWLASKKMGGFNVSLQAYFSKDHVITRMSMLQSK